MQKKNNKETMKRVLKIYPEILFHCRRHELPGFHSQSQYTFWSFSIPILITISISAAPFCTASDVSNTLTAVVLYPFGNPITVHTGKLLFRPLRYFTACFTYAGGMQADAVSYLTASSNTVLMSSHFAVCEKQRMVYFVKNFVCRHNF